MRMNKLALKAIARLNKIDIKSAAQVTRHNPILDSEINIDEELINLKESFDSYYVARESLRGYPKMREHFLHERQVILQHCIGLVERMLRGRRLQYAYTAGDIDHAIRRLVRLLVDDARHTGRRIDHDIMEIFVPFMTIRQRVQARQWNLIRRT